MSISKKSVFVTGDGTEFVNRKDAENHQEICDAMDEFGEALKPFKLRINNMDMLLNGIKGDSETVDSMIAALQKLKRAKAKPVKKMPVEEKINNDGYTSNTRF